MSGGSIPPRTSKNKKMRNIIKQHARALGEYMAARMSGQDGREQREKLEQIEREIEYGTER